MKVSLKFGTPGYIANPYWPEMFQLIEIQKKSGMNRVRSEDRIRAALESHLRKIGLNLDEYEQLQVKAHRPFHINGDGTEIVIPSSSIMACIANTCDVAPRSLRIESPRTALQASDFHTGKASPDGKWERFAVVKSGSGKTLSNQRGFRSSAFIKDFTAEGEIDVEAEMVKPSSVFDLLRFAGRVVGIGASRKMGWGRFEVLAA